MKIPEPDPEKACEYCIRCYAEAHRLDEDYVRERYGRCFRAAGFDDAGILGHMSPEKFIGLLRLVVEEAGMENAPIELPVRYSYLVIDRMPEYRSDHPAPEVSPEEKRERMRYVATYFAEAHRIPVDEAVELFERCDLEELISFGWNSLYGYMDLAGKDGLPNAAVRIEFLRRAIEVNGGVCPELVCPYTVMGRTYDRRLEVDRCQRPFEQRSHSTATSHRRPRMKPETSDGCRSGRVFHNMLMQMIVLKYQRIHRGYDTKRKIEPWSSFMSARNRHLQGTESDPRVPKPIESGFFSGTSYMLCDSNI